MPFKINGLEPPDYARPDSPIIKRPDPQVMYSTGKPGKAIGLSKVECHRNWITQSGVDWWMNFFSSTSDLYVDVTATVFDPLQNDWIAVNAHMWRPTYNPSNARNYMYRDFQVMLTGIEPTSTVPTVYNTVTEFTVTLTDADTEYSYTIPSGTDHIRFRCRNMAADVRYAWTSGKVAGSVEPYQVLPAGVDFLLDRTFTAATPIYFASSVAGVIIEGEIWT